jgi:RHS repeat-associated protein
LSGTADAVTTTFTYEPRFFQLATITDPLNHTWTVGYDSNGRMTGMTDPLNHQTAVGMNAAGQITQLTDPLEHAWQFGYTDADMTSVTDPLGNLQTRFVDAAGRVVSTTDPLGRIMRRVFDKVNRLTTVTDPLGGETAFGYDPNGNVLSLTDALMHATTYSYDTSDRMETRTAPLTHAAAYAYDLKDHLTQVTDRKGQVTTYTYDALDRLTQVTFDDQSTVAYTYDAGDRVSQIADSANGTITRQYDGLNRLTQETTPQGTVTYTYDADGRRATMTVAGQSAVSYGYDDAHRLTSVTQGTAAVSIAYDNADRRSTLTYPNGIVATYVFDAANQLTTLTYTLGQTTLGDLTYTYDAAGNRTSVGGSWARTGLPPALGSATYDAANRIATWDGTAFSYDLNGNFTGDGVRAYEWNPRNELAFVTGPVNATFAYDGLGRRRSKTLAGTTKQFLYDGQNPVQEVTSGTPTANLLSGLATDEYFTRSEGAAASSYLTDALGSSTALADGAGTIETEYTYEPFGSMTLSGASTGNALQFTGREADATGMYFYRTRYYDPRLQRFLAEDPLGELGGTNLHSYVGNRPTGYIDPYGLLQLCCRPVNMPGLRQLGAQHCFIRLSDGTTLGGYNRRGRLRPEADAPDDRCPRDEPQCRPLPGNEGDVRRAWNALPRGIRIYGLDGTSNSIPGEVLDAARIPYTFPSGAWGSGIRPSERFPPR